jgi:signal transduction histidine kinase
MSANDVSAPGVAGERRSLRVLVVEDSEPDVLLMLQLLKRGGFATQHEQVCGPGEMQAALQKGEWDLILADHAMPQFSSLEALHLVKNLGLDVPFIIVSGHIDEETAVAAMRAGAHDYIMKERLARLVPAVERELKEVAVRNDLRRAHEDLEIRVGKRTQDLQAANLKLQNVIAERKRLEAELLEIAENERRRIGLDLHDDLGQKLTGLSLMIKGIEHKLAIDRHPSVEDTRKVHTLIEEIITHTHNLAHQFSALNARGDDLASVLKELADNVRKMFDISCGFTVRGEIPPLPEDATMQLYKISQEAVSNSIKHGKAQHVSISLARLEDELVLTVKNDGLPFSQPAGSKNRMGLRIMNYRANTIGATLEIKPVGKKGTVVACVLPIKNGTKLIRKDAEPVQPRMDTDSHG